MTGSIMKDSTATTNAPTISTQTANMTSITGTTMDADLRRRAKELDTPDGTAYNVYGKLLAWRNLAYEAIEQLEIMESKAGGTEEIQGAHRKFMESPVCKDAVKWQQKPLDCQGVALGGTGKIEVREGTIAQSGQGIHRWETFLVRKTLDRC